MLAETLNRNEELDRAFKAADRGAQGGIRAKQIEPKGSISALCLHELSRTKFKPRAPLLSPILCSQDLAMVFAPRGVGKTHFALALSFAVATGGVFLTWQAKAPRKVLYLDGELPGETMQRRLLMHTPATEPEPGFFRVFTPDLLGMEQALPDLAEPGGQAQIETLIESDTALIVVDNLSAWMRGHKAENDSESWIPMSEWVLSLRRRGLAVLLVHHAGKNGEQRGTSKREDLLDVVIKLSRPKDYESTQGARFLVEFTKARHLQGDDAQSLELQLSEKPDGSARWDWQTAEGSTFEKVVQLACEGLTQAEIARELELNRSTVNRHFRKGLTTGQIRG